jgi:hypothetical protein
MVVDLTVAHQVDTVLHEGLVGYVIETVDAQAVETKEGLLHSNHSRTLRSTRLKVVERLDVVRVVVVEVQREPTHLCGSTRCS